MKKFFLILLSILCLTSCSSTSKLTKFFYPPENTDISSYTYDELSGIHKDSEYQYFGGNLWIKSSSGLESNTLYLRQYNSEQETYTYEYYSGPFKEYTIYANYIIEDNECYLRLLMRKYSVALNAKPITTLGNDNGTFTLKNTYSRVEFSKGDTIVYLNKNEIEVFKNFINSGNPYILYEGKKYYYDKNTIDFFNTFIDFYKDYPETRKAYIQAIIDNHPEYNEKDIEALTTEQDFIGMNVGVVFDLHGNPQNINTTTTENGTFSQIIYYTKYYYADNNIITSIQSK